MTSVGPSGFIYEMRCWGYPTRQSIYRFLYKVWHIEDAETEKELQQQQGGNNIEEHRGRETGEQSGSQIDGETWADRQARDIPADIFWPRQRGR